MYCFIIGCFISCFYRTLVFNIIWLFLRVDGRLYRKSDNVTNIVVLNGYVGFKYMLKYYLLAVGQVISF